MIEAEDSQEGLEEIEIEEEVEVGNSEDQVVSRNWFLNTKFVVAALIQNCNNFQ